MTYYAGFWRRMSAAAIDMGIWVILASWTLGSLPVSFWDDHPEAAGLITIAFFTLWFNYFALCEWRWGQTLGKNWTKISVVSEDGSRLSWGQASMRNLLRLVDLLGIGFLLIGLADTRQRLGDRAAHTIVVPRAPQPESRVEGTSSAATAPAAAGSAAALASAPPPDPGTIVPVPPAPAAPAARLPEITWNWKAAVVGLLAVVVGSLLLITVLVAPFDPELDSYGANIAAQLLLAGTMVAGAILIARRPSRERLRVALDRLGFRRFTGSDLGTAALTWLAYFAFAIAFSALVVQPEQDDIAGELGLDSESIGIKVAVVLALAVIGPIAEEVFFRGVVFAGMRRSMPLWPAAVVSGLLFGSLHAPTGPTTVVPLAALGVALAWLYERTGSIWPPIIVHMFNNGLVVGLAIAGV